jgi:hypothetical protein
MDFVHLHDILVMFASPDVAYAGHDPLQIKAATGNVMTARVFKSLGFGVGSAPSQFGRDG